jgi:hypothetical protein
VNANVEGCEIKVLDGLAAFLPTVKVLPVEYDSRHAREALGRRLLGPTHELYIGTMLLDRGEGAYVRADLAERKPRPSCFEKPSRRRSRSTCAERGLSQHRTTTPLLRWARGELSCRPVPEQDTLHGDAPSRPVYLTHIPRSGGTSVIRAFAASIPMVHVYPSPLLDDTIVAKLSTSYLLSLPQARLTETKLFAPHLPHAVSSLLENLDLFTITVLRDPVQRVRSVLDLMLGDEQTDDPQALERFYGESEWAHGWFMANQLAYYLGATPDQVWIPVPLNGSADDQRRLQSQLGSIDALVSSACGTLETIDAVGTTENLDEFLGLLERRLGLPMMLQQGRRANRSRGRELTNTLRRRIEKTTEADREIYAYAQKVLVRRRA